MERNYVKIKSHQVIDQTNDEQVFDGEAIRISNDIETVMISYHDQNQFYSSIKLYFLEDGMIQVLLSNSQYNAQIELKENFLTHGTYILGNSHLQFDFVLKKIIKKNLDIYFEYDIFTNGNCISKNRLEIEVKKC